MSIVVGTEHKRSTAFPRVILYNLMNLHVICMQHFLLDQLVKILMTVTRKQSLLFIFFYSWHLKLTMINGEDCCLITKSIVIFIHITVI